MKNARSAIAGVALLLVAGQASATPGEVTGMLGMSPVLADSYAAIWLPVPPGQAVTGIRWFNNDANVVFPQVLVASGASDAPVGLDNAVVVATDVQGVTSGWSQIAFSEPYACLGEGLYCLLRFPEGSEYVAAGAGGGAAIGYTSTGAGNQGWLCAGGDMWIRIEGATGLAIEPELVPATPGLVHMKSRPQLSPVSPTAELRSPSPNPFNPQTVLEYSLAEAQLVDLSIFDLSGRLVRRLEHGPRAAGTHRVPWLGDDAEGKRLSSGVYVARLKAGLVVETQQLTMVK